MVSVVGAIVRISRSLRLVRGVEGGGAGSRIQSFGEPADVKVSADGDDICEEKRSIFLRRRGDSLYNSLHYPTLFRS